MIQIIIPQVKANIMFLVDEAKDCPCCTDHLTLTTIDFLDIRETYTLWDLNQIIYN